MKRSRNTHDVDVFYTLMLLLVVIRTLHVHVLPHVGSSLSPLATHAVETSWWADRGSNAHCKLPCLVNLHGTSWSSVHTKRANGLKVFQVPRQGFDRWVETTWNLDKLQWLLDFASQFRQANCMKSMLTSRAVSGVPRLFLSREVELVVLCLSMARRQWCQSTPSARTLASRTTYAGKPGRLPMASALSQISMSVMTTTLLT